MNSVVEKFIRQMGLGIKDKKEEVIQKAITIVQTTKNESPYWVEGTEKERQ